MDNCACRRIPTALQHAPRYMDGHEVSPDTIHISCIAYNDKSPYQRRMRMGPRPAGANHQFTPLQQHPWFIFANKSAHFYLTIPHRAGLVHLINRLRRRCPVGLLRGALHVQVLVADCAPPAKLVRGLAQLNRLQVRQELQADGTCVGLPLGDIRHHVRVRRRADPRPGGQGAADGALAARDAPDGHQRRGRPGGKDLAEARELGVLDGPPFHLPPPAPGNMLDAVAGDAVNDALGVGHHEGHVVVRGGHDADEARGAKLVNLLVPGAVEVQRDAEALPLRLAAPLQDGRVVAADLGVAGAVGRRAVKLVQDEGLDRVRAVVHARGDDEDAKGVFLGGVQPQLRARPVQLGADVQRGPRLVGRHEAGVEGNGGANRLQEDVDGDLGHGRYFSRVLEARGVSVRAEDGDGLVAGRAEGLEALIGLLAVVEGRRHAVDAHEGVGHEAERRPFARRFGVRGFDVAIDCDEVSINENM